MEKIRIKIAKERVFTFYKRFFFLGELFQSKQVDNMEHLTRQIQSIHFPLLYFKNVIYLKY